VDRYLMTTWSGCENLHKGDFTVAITNEQINWRPDVGPQWQDWLMTYFFDEWKEAPRGSFYRFFGKAICRVEKKLKEDEFCLLTSRFNGHDVEIHVYHAVYRDDSCEVAVVAVRSRMERVVKGRRPVDDLEEYINPPEPKKRRVTKC
jgi:hypothetical protein